MKEEDIGCVEDSSPPSTNDDVTDLNSSSDSIPKYGILYTFDMLLSML